MPPFPRSLLPIPQVHVPQSNRIRFFDPNISRTFTGRPLLPNMVSSWSVRVVRSSGGHGGCVQIGVAPATIPREGVDLHQNCGHYINLCAFLKYSGPPHNYRGYTGEEYGPRRESGEYVSDGDTVGVVMDMERGELSFVLNGENLGVAFSGIPTDEPLVPCAVLTSRDCAIEFIY